jgi:putative peptidoglycan lipid II flippase
MQAVRDIYRAYAGRWDSWRIQSVNRRIFSAILTVGGLTVLIKLMAAAKEVVVAHQFGTGDALDAFLIAFLLPSFAINVVAGSFNAALVPTFIQVREHEGREAAQRLFSSVMVWSTALLIAVSALLALTASYILPILGSGFSQEKLELTRLLFFVLLPALTVSGLATIWAAILNANERFALAAMAPMMTPVVTVFALLVMGKVWGIYSLAVGTVCGFVLEAGLLSWGLRRHGFSIIPHWHGIDPAMKQVINQYAPMIAGAFLMGSTTLVNQSMVAMLGPGSVSALSYGNKVVALMLGLGSMPLSTAVLPHFSRMAAIGDWRGVRHTLKTYTRLVLLVAIPLTLLLVYFSEPLVGLLFERGAFTAADTHLVGRVQAFYLLQVPFYVLGIMFVRLISSLKANRILMWGTIISVFVNITLNYLFMKWLGVSGIALSTAMVYIVSYCYLLYMTRRLLKKSADDEHG